MMMQIEHLWVQIQRQSVPLLRTESPIVATGIEKKVAVDSKAVVLSPVSGNVVYEIQRKSLLKIEFFFFSYT